MLHRPVAVVLRSTWVRLPLRSAPFQGSRASRTGNAVLIGQHGYATKPGRPRSTVGEPTKTVKRSVKREARAPSTGAAGKKVKAKKAASKKKTKKPKKELTEAQKTVKAEKLAKVKLAVLKKAALSPPRGRRLSAYNLFVKEHNQGVKSIGEAAAKLKEVSANFKTLAPAEREHYNHLANVENEASGATYKRWVESHSVEEIRIANRVRKQINRTRSKEGKRAAKKWPLIKDERAVKSPTGPWIHFVTNRQASGDFKNIPVTERMALLSQEWKALNESEKKKYKDLSSKDSDRYTEEYKDTFGYMPASANGGHQAQAVAAAA